MTTYKEAGRVDAGEPLEDVDATAIAEDKLELLGHQLAATRDKWYSHKVATGVEKRWGEDLDQYLGRDAATKVAGSEQRSTVFVNITRPKSNAVEARLANMLYPADDRAWGIRPTPSVRLSLSAMQEAQGLSEQWHQMAAQQQDPAQGMPQGMPEGGPDLQQMAQPGPAQTPDVAGGMQPAAQMDMSVPAGGAMPIGFPFDKTPATAEMEVATQRAKAMENEIHDALVECEFVAEARKMLHDKVVLGTGILKGPIVVNRVARSWEKVPGTDEYALTVQEEFRPASVRVSPWNVITDPTCGDDPHNGKGIYERIDLTAKMLRALVGQPGYLEGQIRKVLEQGPVRTTHRTERDLKDQDVINEKMYECWEYWGEFEPDDLRACGVDVEDSATRVVSGCVVMVNNIVIKGFLNPLECGTIPYDFSVMEPDDNTPWGYGVPYLCRPAQRVLNAAWRQMMDNAGVSVGPIVVLKPNLIQPIKGDDWSIRGRKIFNCTDDSADVREAFNVFDMPNYSQQFEQIINLAMMFADEETSVPKITQGEAQNSSVGVTSMQMDSANVVLGRLVKMYDDRITKRHIRRYYDFFMAYSDKDEIKGDFQVEARGSSVLMVRDQQIQSLLQFGQFQQSAVAPMVHWHKWLREVLKAQNLNPTDLLKSDAEIELILNQPPGPTPEDIKAEAAIQVANIRAEAQLASSQAREQGQVAFAEAQTQMARDNSIARMKELEMKRDLALLEYSMKQDISLEQAKTQLAKTAMIEETKRQVAKAKMEMTSNQEFNQRGNTNA